ncbi:hypothetical protein [Pedobacter sp. Leaf41]|jgi:hypothetical protein|nr:hypothetical protein [Pedobacter sp. Leaf41]
MIDPKDKNKEAENEQAQANDSQAKKEETNWDEHQRIDEEGNELDAEDIK